MGKDKAFPENASLYIRGSIMRNKYENFVVDMKDFVIKKNNKLLREEINPALKDVQDITVLIDYIKSHDINLDTYFYWAKFHIQSKLVKLEKYFPGCSAAMWLYCNQDDDMYMLTSPHLRENLHIEYGLIKDEHKMHSPYLSLKEKTIIYSDYSRPATFEMQQCWEIWSSHGYHSSWTFPLFYDDIPIGTLGLVYTHEIARLPDEAEIKLVQETLHGLREKFYTILIGYDDKKCEDTKKIL